MFLSDYPLTEELISRLSHTLCIFYGKQAFHVKIKAKAMAVQLRNDKASWEWAQGFSS